VLEDLELKGKYHAIWPVGSDSESNSKNILLQLAVSEQIGCLWMAMKVGENLHSKIQFDQKKMVINF
jgi:hypothetical protein